MDDSKIILASASPRRREILSAHALDFETVPSGADELAEAGSPRELSLENAVLKASSVARGIPNRIVLGADTVVALDGVVYGKPRDAADAFSILSKLSGRTHSVFTGVALARFDGVGLKVLKDAEESKVTFKALDADAINSYLNLVDVSDKAGAYAAQECGSAIIERIDGDFENVMGLPFALVKKLLDRFVSGL